MAHNACLFSWTRLLPFQRAASQSFAIGNRGARRSCIASRPRPTSSRTTCVSARPSSANSETRPSTSPSCATRLSCSSPSSIIWNGWLRNLKKLEPSVSKNLIIGANRVINTIHKFSGSQLKICTSNFFRLRPLEGDIGKSQVRFKFKSDKIWIRCQNFKICFWHRRWLQMA